MKSEALEILGLDKDADQVHVKSRYRELAKRYHPDTNKSDPTAAWMFKQVQWAYSELQNEPAGNAERADRAYKNAAHSRGQGERPQNNRRRAGTPNERARERDRERREADKAAWEIFRKAEAEALKRNAQECLWITAALTTGVVGAWGAEAMNMTNPKDLVVTIIGISLGFTIIRVAIQANSK